MLFGHQLGERGERVLFLLLRRPLGDDRFQGLPEEGRGAVPARMSVLRAGTTVRSAE